MPSSDDVDHLAPEARFALRAVALGLPIDETGALMRLDPATVRKHLRTAGRGLGAPTPPPSEGDAALLAALAPALAAGREPPSRPSSKSCPEPDVTAALAAIALDGPLMLAEIDHAADCPKCLARLVELRRAGPVAAPAAAPARRASWPIVVGVVIVLGAVVWWISR